MNKYEVCCKSNYGDNCILTSLTSFSSQTTVTFTHNPAQTEKVVGEGSFGKALLCKRKSDSKRCIIKQVRKLFSNSTTYCCVKQKPTSVFNCFGIQNDVMMSFVCDYSMNTRLSLHNAHYVISFIFCDLQISLSKMSPREAKQTQQEATLLSKLNHPNIVSFWESFVTGTNLYIVMEFANGEN